MDNLFTAFIGKPQLNPAAKIITIVAENFSLLDDQAKFLKATLAIPLEKKLPLDRVCKQLIQVGPLHRDIRTQIDKASWTVSDCDEATRDNNESIIDKLEADISRTTERKLIVVNDASRLQLLLDNKKEVKRFLRLVDKWRRDKHFVVVLYQQSQPPSSDTFLRDLEVMTDACVRVKSFKSCYLMCIWYQPIAIIKTLIPPKVETDYGTCKIGKSFWSPDLLCFYERKKVDRNFNPDLVDTILATGDSTKVLGLKKPGMPPAIEEEEDDDGPESALQRLGLDAGADDEDFKGPDALSRNPNASTLPYIRAQNPEQSRIFYYPDKDDDVDEEDPDDDLGI